MSNALKQQLKAVIELGGDSLCVSDQNGSASWSAVNTAISQMDALLSEINFPSDAAIGVLSLSSVPNAIAVLAALGSGRCAAYFNGLQPIEKLSSDIAAVRPAILFGAAEDFNDELKAVLRNQSVTAVAISANGELRLMSEVMPLPERYHSVAEDDAIEIQTSGTTGDPKRIKLSTSLIVNSMREGIRAASNGSLKLKRSPTLMFSPLGHAGGTFALLLSAFEARPTIIFKKFSIDKFQPAMREYRPRFVSLPPPMLRMVLDSDMTKEDLSSLLAARCGTAPLDPATQQEFEERFEVPVLVTYGATEFMGALARWTLEDHKAHIETKRGSVGRVSPGTEIRIVDQASGEPLPIGEVGIVEARGPRIQSDEWLATTDLGRIDEDDFLYIAGRADDAIIRGGFKIMAGQVASILKRHAKVNDASVIGIPDARLGEVPVAAVEPKKGGTPPTEEELSSFAREHLIAYQVPARILVVNELPRTLSMKIKRADVRALFAEA